MDSMAALVLLYYSFKACSVMAVLALTELKSMLWK
jgi:hypothetical protein